MADPAPIKAVIFNVCLGDIRIFQEYDLLGLKSNDVKPLGKFSKRLVAPL